MILKRARLRPGSKVLHTSRFECGRSRVVTGFTWVSSTRTTYLRECSKSAPSRYSIDTKGVIPNQNGSMFYFGTQAFS